MLSCDTQTLEVSIANLFAGYQQGQLSVSSFVELSQEQMRELDRRGPTLKAMITVANDVEERATALDHSLANGSPLRPLHGVPVVIKDNINVAGLPTTGGCAALSDFVPVADAPVVARLKAAGAIILGKSSMSEFAWGTHDTENSVIEGPSRNPYHFEYATGGSSGGTGVAVAAGYCVAGLGTDTGCSVRAPSSINCLAGLRPTHGLLNMDGVMPMNADWDTVGPMARTVTDLAIVLEVIAGDSLSKERNELTRQLTDGAGSGQRVGVLRQLATPSDCDPAVLGLFSTAISDMKTAGIEVIDPIETKVLKSTKFDNTDWYLRFRFDLDRFLSEMGAHPRSLEEVLKTGKVLDRYVNTLRESLAWPHNPPDHPRQEQMRETTQRYRDAFLDLMNQAMLDAFIFPTFRFPPVLNGSRDAELAGNDAPVGSNNNFASLIGFPALNVPMGFVEPGLPVGLQIMGRPYSEACLLRIGYDYEQLTQHRIPPELSQ